MPTEYTFRRLFEATFLNAKKGIYSNETDSVDLCCRSLHKCDAYKQIELNHTNALYIRHCECVHSFQKCLENLNTSLSNEFAFIYSINTTKCYAKDHPIIKCISFDANLELKADTIFEFINSAERALLLNRCLKYDLDQSLPQQLQIFDVPFNNHAMSTFECKLHIVR